jgi:tetratricopeptide (TPR) repeat protein
VVAQQASTSSRAPVVLSGDVPPIADPYFPRPETGPDLVASLPPGLVVVLTPAEPAPGAQGGTGKTQLAVEYAHAMWSGGQAEVLVWVTASSREAIITGLAQAAASVGAASPDNGAEVAASNFIIWLAHTRQPWVLIIDDLAQPAHLDGLWPAGPAGRVIITTRLPGSAIRAASGNAVSESSAPIGAAADGNLRIIPVGGFSRREALEYLNTRLTAYPDQRIEALDLGKDLGGLPLAITQAAAVITTRDGDCREYRTQLAERRAHMESVFVDGVTPELLATWSLAAECAHELPPVGLAWPALALAAMLDPHGIPGAVLTSPTACGYIIGHPSTGGGPDQNMVRRAISNLGRAGLLTIDPATAVRTVRMHPSVRAAVRAFIPQAELEEVVLAAADALHETWPEYDSGTPGNVQLDQAMRDCLCALREIDGGMLWKPDAHPVLFRAGMSYDGSMLTDSAISYWQYIVTTSTRLLGPAHANSVMARDRLASSYESAERLADAVAVFTSALADRERNLGPEHLDTIAARARLAHAYASAGRTEAIAIYERTAADFDRQLGPGHPSTMATRASLAGAYQAAGRDTDAIRSCETLLADAERLRGAGNPATLAARTSLADAYLAAGKAKDAIEQYRRALSAHEANHGRDNPDAIAARASLASALRRAGKVKDAIGQYERVLADRERTAGPDHTDTITARANLAYAYRSAGQLREALPHYEQTLADRERLQGADHRDTRLAHTNLASVYQQVGRISDAIPHYERAVADSERMQGSGDIETLTGRCSLASALFAAGRLMEVVTVLRRALADCEHYLGPDHPMTRTVRDNLKTAATN